MNARQDCFNSNIYPMAKTTYKEHQQRRRRAAELLDGKDA